MTNTIGFVGLGNMGGPMARNLARKGFQVRAYDMREEAREAVADEPGLQIVGSIAEASDAPMFITMLPDNQHVLNVVLGADGAANSLPDDALVIDMSTISPMVARDVQAKLDQRGLAFVDAPVSGGTVGAEAATLTIMAGGESTAFDRAHDALEALGTTIVYAGGPGMGQVFKLCNQIVCVGNLTAIAEALSLCRAGGGDVEKLVEALGGGAADSWMLQNLAPHMIEGNDGIGFPIDLQLKDLRLVSEATHALDVSLPNTALITSLFISARAEGGGAEGTQSIYKVLDRLSGRGSGAN